MKRDDLSNQTFGFLKVSDEYKLIPGKGGRTNIFWKCTCTYKNCGKIKWVRASTLKRKDLFHTCGCYQKEQLSDRNTMNIAGRIFGYVKVLEIVEERSGNSRIWKCECLNCNRIFNCVGRHLIRGMISCGCLNESRVSSECKKYFENKYNAKVEYNILRSPKTGYHLPYDIYVEYNNIKYFIEINGGQHYARIPFYHKTDGEFEYQIYKDKLKEKYAKENGVFIPIDIREYDTSQKAISHIERIMEK